MTWFDAEMKPWLDTLTAIGTVVALVTLIITIYKNRGDEEYRKQQDLLEQCKRTLEWAYHALMPDPEAKIPESNRLNWLTAARHILAYQKLKRLITKTPHTFILEDFEEFWRHRFYLALSDLGLRNPNYWSAPAPIHVNIYAPSALVILNFSAWPDGKDDPIDLSRVEIESLKNGVGLEGAAGRGLLTYMTMQDEVRQTRAQVTTPQKSTQ